MHHKAAAGRSSSEIRRRHGKLKVGVGIALMCSISAEMLGSSSGLGYMILTASNLFDTGTTVVGMLVIGLIGLAFDYVFGRIQKRIFW